MDINEIEYEDRIVIYFDLLGFKYHIANSLDETGFVHVRNVIYHLANEKKVHDKRNNEFGSDGLEISIFSDNAVLSIPLGDEFGNIYIIAMVEFLQRELLELGYLVRGGMSVGKLYHKDNIVFGPALVEAVNIEQTTIYPRICFTTKTYEKIDTRLKKNGKYAYPNDIKAFNELIMKYKDESLNEFYYLDFLSQYGEFDEPEYYLEYIKKVKKIIEKEKTKIIDSHTYDKYEWFETYLRNVCKNLDISFEEL